MASNVEKPEPEVAPGSLNPSAKSPLLQLPTEIITHIIAYLPAISLARVSATSKRLYDVVHTDGHWKSRVLSYNIPQHLKSSEPFKSWENLFLGHYPFWFLPKHKIWFADGTDTDGGLSGQMIVTQYDHRTGNIMGYTITGEKGDSVEYAWPEKPNVSIHEFHPRIRLHLENPVIRLRPRPGALPEAYDRRTEREPVGLASQRSAQSDLNQAHRIDSHVLLARAIAPELQHESMRLWPPQRIPAIERVRQLSHSMWSPSQLMRRDSPGEIKGTSFERPTAHTDVCESAFRLRRRLAGKPARLYHILAGGLENRDGGGVATYSALPEDAYRPTKERPYQGIWVGDYAGHGCEFLLIQQKITKKEIRASEPVKPRLDNLFNIGNPLMHDEILLHEDRYRDLVEAAQEAEGESQSNGEDPAEEALNLAPGDEIGEVGRIEAIKLTGDANVPRGEYTFVAEDIGRNAELYVGESAEFKGKRVVGSWGHIAARGFKDDVYIKADLILVSHNCLAQYWHEFGHVAFYRRVEVDKFSSPEDGDVTLQL